MIKVEEIDKVLTIRCGNEINGQVLYWTTLYHYKNLVIDTGCPHTAHEIRDFFHNKIVKPVLITHYHKIILVEPMFSVSLSMLRGNLLKYLEIRLKSQNIDKSFV